MVQRWELRFKLNEKGYDHIVSGTGTYMKLMRCEFNSCYMISKEWIWACWVTHVCMPSSWEMISVYDAHLVKM